ncbi:GAD-like domain-containing protein [Massilia scottii]|uniref:GAD-like domain-containing protein n=1 Tax=Massilia scottii TaxID=3057166 RepID=UPI0027968D90|nr:GAD-like domain-containing protein [Massilia sp. CCM 9029]MDQ1835462.1 GAD-like domain-containing protein [Massilia sp. CCM 9029]
MRDEDFEVFIDEFGEATQRFNVPTTSIERWRGKFPDQLLSYWKDEGWCAYANGLFWTVNPDDYEDLVDEWLHDTPLEQIDTFQVIARSAFGELFLWGEKTGDSATILCATHTIICLGSNLKRKLDDQDFYARTFFSNKSIADCDLEDEAGNPLFERALAKLGPLGVDEVYGFEPAIVLGGKMNLDNLVKLNLDVHLTILRQLASPTIPFSNIDIGKLQDS